MPVKRGKLKPEDFRRLQINYSTLLDELDASYIVTYLFSKGVFTLDDKQLIQSEKTRRDRAKKLLDFLFNSGPGEAYSIFTKGLEEEQDYLAKQLRETDISSIQIEPVRPDYSWYDSWPDEIKDRKLTDADASRLSGCFDENWQLVITRLNIPKIQIDQERHSHPFVSPMVIITNLLVKWRQRFDKKATIRELMKVLQEVDETGVCSIEWDVVKQALNRQ